MTPLEAQKSRIRLGKSTGGDQAENMGAPCSATCLEVTSTLPFFLSSVRAGSHTETTVDVATVVGRHNFWLGNGKNLHVFRSGPGS